MTQLKGLVFDMDGTLVDNLEYHFAAFEEYAKREGFELLEPVTLKHNGMHLKDIFPALLGEKVVAEQGLEKLSNGKETTYREMYRPHIAPIAGLIELLQAAKKAGIKCAIGSSGCRENVEMIIDGLGVADLVDASISGSDVTHGKPHPEIFTKAHEALGLKAEECIVSEDAGTIEEVYEPFLIKEGFLKRTPRGREATELAYKHLGLTQPEREGELF